MAPADKSPTESAGAHKSTRRKERTSVNEDEDRQVWLVRSRVGHAIVRGEQELLRIRIQDVVHVEIPVVDTLERHAGRGVVASRRKAKGESEERRETGAIARGEREADRTLSRTQQLGELVPESRCPRFDVIKRVRRRVARRRRAVVRGPCRLKRRTDVRPTGAAVDADSEPSETEARLEAPSASDAHEPDNM